MSNYKLIDPPTYPVEESTNGTHYGSNSLQDELTSHCSTVWHNVIAVEHVVRIRKERVKFTTLDVHFRGNFFHSLKEQFKDTK